MKTNSTNLGGINMVPHHEDTQNRYEDNNETTVRDREESDRELSKDPTIQDLASAKRKNKDVPKAIGDQLMPSKGVIDDAHLSLSVLAAEAGNTRAFKQPRTLSDDEDDLDLPEENRGTPRFRFPDMSANFFEMLAGEVF